MLARGGSPTRTNDEEASARPRYWRGRGRLEVDSKPVPPAAATARGSPSPCAATVAIPPRPSSWPLPPRGIPTTAPSPPPRCCRLLAALRPRAPCRACLQASPTHVPLPGSFPFCISLAFLWRCNEDRKKSCRLY